MTVVSEPSSDLSREEARILRAVNSRMGGRALVDDHAESTGNGSSEKSGSAPAVEPPTKSNPVADTATDTATGSQKDATTTAPSVVTGNSTENSSENSGNRKPDAAKISIDLSAVSKVLMSPRPVPDDPEPEDTTSPRGGFIKLPTKKRKEKAIQGILAAVAEREKEYEAVVDEEQQTFNLASEHIRQQNYSGFSEVIARMKNINLVGTGDTDGNTLLHWCAASNEPKMAQVLLNAGAIQIANANGDTPLDLAKCGLEDGEPSFQEIVNLLSQ